MLNNMINNEIKNIDKIFNSINVVVNNVEKCKNVKNK